jgi:hypothetical protein
MVFILYGITIFIYLNLFNPTYQVDIKNSSLVLLNTTQTFDIGIGCKEIKIPNNYKKLILELKQENLDKVLITDIKIDKCTENWDIYKCCHKNATFCMENSFPVKNDFKLNYCIDYTYIYACIFGPGKEKSLLRQLDDSVTAPNESSSYDNDTTKNESLLNETITFLNDTTQTIVETVNNTIMNISQANNTEDKVNNTQIDIKPIQPSRSSYSGYIELDVKIVRGIGCTTAEFSSETECASLGIGRCRDPLTCSSSCTLIECRTDKADASTKIFSLCLPIGTKDIDIINKCKNHISFEDKSPEPFIIPCNRTRSQEEMLEKESSHSFFKLLLVVFGVVILAIFITSVYYRFKISIDNVAPFDPPSFCPNFVFPRSSHY